MKGLGTILAIIGVVVLIVAVVNHFVTKIVAVSHSTTIIGVVGVIILAIGLFMMMSRRKATV